MRSKLTPAVVATAIAITGAAAGAATPAIAAKAPAPAHHVAKAPKHQPLGWMRWNDVRSGGGSKVIRIKLGRRWS